MNLIAEWLSVALMIGLIGFVCRSTTTLRTIQRKDRNAVREVAIKQMERLVKLETKMDIYLDHEGFSIQKIDRAINEHLEELKLNDRPTVGCINIATLYKEV